jgi:large subunit ribosomal protein L9
MVSDRIRTLKKSASADADRIKSLAITIKAKVGEEGKLFGSVTSMDIAEAMQAQGVTIDKRKITLEEPIKRIGDYTVPVKLHTDVVADLKVSVVAAE